MNSLSAFFTGIASSLTAMLISILFIRLRWPYILKKISRSKIFGHGVEFGYKNQESAKKDMIKSFNESNNIYVLCMRAYSVTQRERDFSYILQDRLKNIKLLIADPGNLINDNPEIRVRALERSESPEGYRRSIYNSIESIKRVMENNTNIECKLHKLASCHRLYITDDRIFISFFMPELSGTQLPIITVIKGSPLYRGMSRYFDQIWSQSRNVNELNYTPA